MKKTTTIPALLAALLGLTLAGGCGTEKTTTSGSSGPTDQQIPGHGALPQDTTPKEGPRLMPAEAYLRSYLQIFGGLSPEEVQSSAKAGNLFHQWTDYLNLIGLPDYGRDTGRAPETNALMLATFERLGIALCDKALEHDWQSDPPVALKDRRVFAFDPPGEAPSQEEFAKGFDVMHRTFLGYPAKLARTDRVARFYGLYGDVVKAHDPAKTPKLTASQAGWAAVCYGLVRHPELHLY